ncbi:C2H2-type zinc finger transcription factor [Mucor lusitanicus]
MKLRNKKKRALGNIKQEDCKPTTLINTQSSTTEVANTSTFDLAVKQEDSKDHKVLLKQQSKLPNLKSVLEHRKSNHINRYCKSTQVKNLDKEPDVHNPDFYCSSCEKGYINKYAYRIHLRKVHYMVLKRLHNRITPKIDITPDPNDPNLHCRVCDFTYKNKYYYKEHCRYTHALNPTESASQASSSRSLKDTYCQTCEKRLSNIQNYRNHLFAVHKIDIRQPQQRRNDILPNANDPDFYCHSCEKKMGNRAAFIQHLRRVHSIFKSARPQTGLKPDVDDPNNYCSACQKMYSSKDKYRVHLRIVHRMILPSLRGSVNHKQLPDPYNRDCYCSYAQMKTYRRHCKEAHFMTLEHSSIVNPNAEINVNDPDLYFSPCERSFSKKLAFKQHLARVHSII